MVTCRILLKQGNEGMRAAWEFVIMLSLSNGMSPSGGLTNVVDVTQDHAVKRACQHQWGTGLLQRDIPI